ncbi:hypothetical protein Tco_0139695 [Tanacetum coccineum]
MKNNQEEEELIQEKLKLKYECSNDPSRYKSPRLLRHSTHAHPNTGRITPIPKPHRQLCIHHLYGLDARIGKKLLRAGIKDFFKKTEVPVTSSSRSSDLASKFLNISDIPQIDAEIVSPLDVHVHHEFPK